MRFYDEVEKQNKNYAYVNGNLRTWKLYTDIYHFPAFQIQVDSSDTSSSDVTVYLVDMTDLSETDITSKFTWDTDLYIETFTSYNYLIYNRNGNLSPTLTEGTYYLKVVATDTFYSEVFCVCDLTGKLIIDYYGDNDIDSIDYTNGAKLQFQNKLILDTKLVKPQYNYYEEGTEDGEANFIPTFQKVTKRYQFVFYAPEYVIDAVTLLPMHDTISVTTEYNETETETISVEEFDVMNVEWTDTKGFAKVTCEFRADPVIKTYHANDIT